MGNGYYVVRVDCILLDIWSYDPVVVADLQGSMVEIGEPSDVVAVDVANAQEEVRDFIVDPNHYAIYPLIISWGSLQSCVDLQEENKTY